MNEFETKVVNTLHSLALSFDRLSTNQQQAAIALEKIAELLKQSLPRSAPSYKAILEQWQDFDWSSIGAEIEVTDNYGVASVIWQGQRYKRRSPDNVYGAVIFFSRCVGKAQDGSNLYERLITFEPLEDIKIEPISRKAEQLTKQ